jgi:hypothetical protein
MSLSMVRSMAASTRLRVGSASYHAMISRAPTENGVRALKSGTRLLILELSNSIEWALSPSSPEPHFWSTA